MKKIIVLTGWILLLTACNKQDEWLNIKSNKGDIIPATLQNFQAILDNDTYMNDYYPGMPLVSADNYYVNYANWIATANYGRNVYVWAQDVYQGNVIISDWNNPYANVEYANIVLEGLEKIERTNQNLLYWDNLRGAALFYRAYAFYNLVNEFAKPYSATTAATDLGIPLRLSADINVKSVRASVEDVYKQIIGDLNQAVDLLPVSPQYQSRPGKTAAEALLAKIYLTMEDYANAGVYADKALNRVSNLIDFNSLALGATKPFPVFPNNPEIIFYATNSIFSLAIINGLMDSTLLKSYAANDLRKTAFYATGASGTTFKGQYSGSFGPFGGLATNELFLIRAEINARLGKTAAAMQDLNTLLIKRWKTGTFLPYTALTPDDALSQVLIERRKELPFTGTIRWDDLRRLNKDPRFAKTLTRNLNGQTYTLPASDPRYVLPIPETEIRLSGIQQNPR
jgi:hypothetical protein